MDRRANGGLSRRNASLVAAAAAGVLVLMGVPDRTLTPEEAAAERTEHAVGLVVDELRGALEAYRRDHGEWPGLPPGSAHGRRASEEWLVRQITRATNAAGDVAPAPEEAFPFGPYLETFPVNPVTRRADVRLLEPGEAFPAQASGGGWIYDPVTGALRLDAEGTVPFTDDRYFDL